MNASPRDLEGSTLAGKYRLIRLIGEGGMGVVYEAKNTYINKPVAVKVMLGEVSRESEAIERFKREAAAAGSIGHPAICEVFDLVYDESRNIIFIVMELLKGEPLDDLIEKHVMIPLKPAMNIIRQVLEGLEAAHSAGIIHRDLKPENIFLVKTHDGKGYTVKIMDFGISKFKTGIDQKSITQSGTIIGTPFYMSPEQVQATGKIDHRSDIYSVAAVFFEMLTGKMPFDAGNVSGVLIQIAIRPFPKVKDYAANVPGSVGKIIQKATARNCHDRYSSAREMRDALMKLGLCSTKRIIATAEITGVDARELNAPTQSISVFDRLKTTGLLTGGKRTIVLAAIAASVLIVIGLFVAWSLQTSGGDPAALNNERGATAGDLAYEEKVLEALEEVAGKEDNADLTEHVFVTIAGWKKECTLKLADKPLAGKSTMKIPRRLLPANLSLQCGDMVTSRYLSAGAPAAVTLEARATSAKTPASSSIPAAAETTEPESDMVKKRGKIEQKKKPGKAKGEIDIMIKTDYNDD